MLASCDLLFLSQLINNYIQARFFQESATITVKPFAAVVKRSPSCSSGAMPVKRLNLKCSRPEQTCGLQRPACQSRLRTSKQTYLRRHFACRAKQMKSRPLMGPGRAQPRPQAPSSSGIPADLIRNRPDIRSAERSFAAATAGIGVSEAQLSVD